MPYLRLSSLPLDAQTKRHLADELTATVLDILPDGNPEWTSVHFTPFQPDEFAIAGRLVSDGGIADTHLEISAPGVDEKRWFALRNRLTDVVVEALCIPDSERWHVNVKLNGYDPHTYAVAGNAADELDFGDGTAGRVPPNDVFIGEGLREGGGRSGNVAGGIGRTTVVLGFTLGAYLGYRWLTERLRGDASVDAAPPVDTAGAPDGAHTMPAESPSPESAPAREY
jgi:phenylpyruvate tautomerase PptA (4-oxalocrotonate tautomerase family)